MSTDNFILQQHPIIPHSQGTLRRIEQVQRLHAMGHDAKTICDMIYPGNRPSSNRPDRSETGDLTCDYFLRRHVEEFEGWVQTIIDEIEAEENEAKARLMTEKDGPSSANGREGG